MKQSTFIGAALLFVASVVFGVVLFGKPIDARAGLPTPTQAPPPTAGTPPEIKGFSGPLLEKPLTRKQALQIAYDFDQRNATWDKSWSPTDLNNESGRVTVELFKTRNVNGEKAGPKSENGPMWVVTVRGNVRWHGFNGNDALHDGMVYQIAQESGNILGFNIGITR
jgi:hypothetical protein